MIDEQTIRSLLAEQRINYPGLSLLVEHLTAGINNVLLTAARVGHIEKELLGLGERYEENCADLDTELTRLVDACKHPSWMEKDGLPVCNICGGGLVEEEICGIQ